MQSVSNVVNVGNAGSNEIMERSNAMRKIKYDEKDDYGEGESEDEKEDVGMTRTTKRSSRRRKMQKPVKKNRCASILPKSFPQAIWVNLYDDAFV